MLARCFGLALVFVAGCYTGLPDDRMSAATCTHDDDCLGGVCTQGACMPTSDAGPDTGSTVTGGSTGDGTSENPDEGSGGATVTSGGSTASTTTTGESSQTGNPPGTSTSDDGTSGPVDTGDTEGSTGVDSGSATTTGPVECNPSDPSVQVPPAPGDAAGESCCTTAQSCSGTDVKGQPAQTHHVGNLLSCIDGQWVIDDRDCIESCALKGNGYLGCFWDSNSGLKPICGCK